jgi:hypothetical protein
MELQISIDELRKRQLFVATPMYGGSCQGLYAKSMCDLTILCTKYGIEMRFWALFNESLITRARNYCVDEFMRSGYSNMLFLDSDIGFDPNDVIAMLALQSEESEYDVLSGPYPKKCISWEKIKIAVDKGAADENPNNLEKYVGDFVFNLDPESGKTSIPISEPAQVLEAGTGFMMIKRSAFEKFITKFPQYMYKPDHVRTEHFDGSRQIMQYFQAEIDGLDYASFLREEFTKLANTCEPTDAENLRKDVADIMKRADELNAAKSNRYLSEDYWFCQKLRDAGGKIFLCPWMKTQHVGTYIFGGSLADLASLGISATASEVEMAKQKKK